MKEADLASQRDREHAERMMQLQALQLQNEKSESFEGTLKRTLGWIKDMGMEPQELISRVFGSNESESESSTLTSLAKIASTTGEILRSQRPPEPQYADPQMYQQQQLMMQQQQMIEQQQMLEQEQAEQMARAQQAEEMVQQLEQNEAEPQAPQSNLPIGQQKSARLALRRLVTELKRCNKSAWEDRITVALTGELSIYHYCQDVGTHAALVEAGAEEAFALEVCKELKKSVLVPDDMNLGVQL